MSDSKTNKINTSIFLPFIGVALYKVKQELKGLSKIKMMVAIPPLSAICGATCADSPEEMYSNIVISYMLLTWVSRVCTHRYDQQSSICC
ncbi:hypothetical protein GDO78_009420 [Eleutherodactylus coqui]|uniref:Uncharacterized protein n=1 Tax=Eleutherodactylus coqui TaxID=57060 RepID=A0A8J6F9U2_ELECQ|nr:hypothetical protein GDO78_009420 [Eleutherodactylus coqui]